MWGDIMQLAYVRYFLALFDELSFCEAAKRCSISQPSLTNAIHRLERQIGGALFLRRPSVQPTPLAVALKPRFKQIAKSTELLHQDAKRLIGSQAGPSPAMRAHQVNAGVEQFLRDRKRSEGTNQKASAEKL
jgi:DNA-binding transcriptional LysR family regulator